MRNLIVGFGELGLGLARLKWSLSVGLTYFSSSLILLKSDAGLHCLSAGQAWRCRDASLEMGASLKDNMLWELLCVFRCRHWELHAGLLAA